MKLIIEDDEGRKTVVPVVRDEITIGRQDGNTIKLTERNVSRRHARFWKDSGALLLEDLESYNGVRVNGDKITGPTPVKEGDLIEIGDYDLEIQGKLEASAPQPKTTPAALKPAPAAAPKPASKVLPTAPKQVPVAPAPAAQPAPPVAAAPKAATNKTIPPIEPKAKPQAEPGAARDDEHTDKDAPDEGEITPPFGVTAPVTASEPIPVPEPAPEPEPSPQASAAPSGATAIINIHKLMAQSQQQVEARDLPKNEMPRLVGLAGTFRAKEFYLMRTEWKIGRTEENDLSIDHQSISRQHCKFVLESEGWKLYDNKSSNGVKVNGEEYAAVNVRPGDTVELGHVKFRFCAPGEKFTPPPEKVEGAPAPAPGGKPLPTTAELIAGAQGKGPQAKAAAASKGGLPIPAIVGAVVVVAAIGGFIAFKGMGPKDVDAQGNPIGKNAVKHAKSAADKKDFKKALELAEAAGEDAPKGFKEKFEAEAKGQDLNGQFEAALARGDGEAALAALEKCATDASYFCGKVKDRDAEAKALFAKKYLAAAAAAKGTNPQACNDAVTKVLAKDPGNSDAQAIQAECSGAKVPPVAPPPKADTGPSQKDRDANGSRLLAAAVAKVQGGDPAGGVADLKACVAQKPAKEILARCLKNLGVAYSRAGDLPSAVDALKKYKPYCGDDCAQIDTAIARWSQ